MDYIHENLISVSQYVIKAEKTTNLFSKTEEEIGQIRDTLNKSNGSQPDRVKQKFAHVSVTLPREYN